MFIVEAAVVLPGTCIADVPWITYAGGVRMSLLRKEGRRMMPD